MRILLFSLVAICLAPAAVPLVARTPAPHAAAVLPLNVNGFLSRAGDRVRITAVAQLETPGVRLTAASITLTGPGGKPAGLWTAKAADLALPALVATFDVAPGAYQLHATVTDAAGSKGTADANVTAALTRAAGTLTLGTMVLGVDGPAFSPRLLFRAEPVAAARFELYGGTPGMNVVIEMEIATTDEGPRLARLKPKVVATPEPDRYVVEAEVDLTGLSPGRYVVRAITGIDGQPAATLRGALRKVR